MRLLLGLRADNIYFGRQIHKAPGSTSPNKTKRRAQAAADGSKSD